MPLRDLLAFIEVPAEPAPEPQSTTPALAQAVALAQGTGAHLHVVVSAARIVPPTSPFYASFASSLAHEANERCKAVADGLAAAAHAAARTAGIDATVEAELQPVETATVAAARLARRFDLVVVDQPKTALDARGSIFQSVLFEGARPVFVAPTGHPPVKAPKRAIFAWDGSSHAARAIAGALELFALSDVDVVSVTGEKELGKTLGAAEMVQHVARHGVTARASQVASAGQTVAATLEAHARASGADLIVMGGYGHSRWREMLLGGVTRDLTERGQTPLLLAY